MKSDLFESVSENSMASYSEWQ